MRSMRRAAAGAALLMAAAGCGGGDDVQGTPAAQVDTTNTDALDGMSSREVEAKAEALTPEQAAARGIVVDSSIHVENLSSSDSAPAGTSPAAPVEAGKPASPAARPAGPDSGQ
jgi:hypothetical protein